VAELAVEAAALDLGEPEHGALARAVASGESLAEGLVDAGGRTAGDEGGQGDHGRVVSGRKFAGGSLAII